MEEVEQSKGLASKLKSKVASNMASKVASSPAVKPMSLVQSGSVGGGTTKTYDFSGIEEWEEESGKGKTTWTFASVKGAGKTTAILEFQKLYGGDMLCFSYDGKTQKIKHKFHRDNDHIHILDVRKQFIRDPAKRLESGNRCVDMVMWRLSKIEDDGVDWIFHDYFDLMPVLAEMKARKLHNKSAKQPVSGFDQMWKDRKAIIQDIHSTSLRKSKYGVLYAGYTIRENIMMDGEVIRTGPRKPNWNDIIEAETDVTVIVEMEEEILPNGRRHTRYFFIDNSKEDYPLDRTWYLVNSISDLMMFVNGDGREVDRAPPTPISLPIIQEIKPSTKGKEEAAVLSEEEIRKIKEEKKKPEKLV